jgi:hypothetical protein
VLVVKRAAPRASAAREVVSFDMMRVVEHMTCPAEFARISRGQRAHVGLASDLEVRGPPADRAGAPILAAARRAKRIVLGDGLASCESAAQ